MEKRFLLAIVLCLGIVLAWAKIAPLLFPEMFKQPAKKTPVAATSTASTSTTTSTAAPATTTAAPETTPAMTAAPSTVAPIAAETAHVVTVDTPNYTALFTNRGARLISFRLKRYNTRGDGPVELVQARDPKRLDYPFFLAASDPQMTLRLNDALYAVDEQIERGERVLTFRYAGNGIAVTKTFRFTDEYLFKFNVSVSPKVPYRVSIGPGIRTLTKEEVDTRGATTANGNGAVQRQGDFKLYPREKGDDFREFAGVDYVGIDDNYFLTVLRPSHSGDAVLRRVEVPQPHGKPNEKRKDYYAALNGAADGTVSGEAFFGPKETKLLDRNGLGNALQFGRFGIIARFFLDALTWINKTTKNYGWAIIVLTILIKVVLYPLQHKSIVSMRKMQKLQPKVEAIKNKYKKAKQDPEQRQKMQMETMKLYQAEGVNPMAGCLPMLLQLPILWGFFNLLSHAIELRGAPFMLWIHDLSEKDPYYITPILMTVTMFLQTYMTPSTGDPAQRRMFLILPLMFGFFFKDAPSGLVLYWLVQNVLTIIQQAIMNKWWKEHPAELQAP